MYQLDKGATATVEVEFWKDGELYTPFLLQDTKVYLPGATLLGNYTATLVSVGKYRISFVVPMTASYGVGSHVWSYKVSDISPVAQTSFNYGVAAGGPSMPTPVYQITSSSSEAGHFGRIHEMTRNIFLEKITNYFETSGVRSRYAEIPNIEKYEITDAGIDSYSTALNVVAQFPDIFEKLPLVAITTTGGRRKPMNVGFPTAFSKSHDFGVISASDEPYNLTLDDTLRYTLNGSAQEISFPYNSLPSFTGVTISNLFEYFDQVASTLRVRNNNNKLELRDAFGRDIVITGGTAATKLGFSINQTNDPSEFYEYILQAEDMDVLIDVLSSDRNQRVELMDLIRTLVGVYVFEENIGQWLNSIGEVIFGDSISERGENEIPLDNAPFSKVYTDSITIPVTTILYLARNKTNQSINYGFGTGVIRV